MGKKLVSKKKFHDLLQKEKLAIEDLIPFYECLTAKQKKALAFVGLVHMSCDVHKNPRILLEKINIDVKNFFGNGEKK